MTSEWTPEQRKALAMVLDFALTAYMNNEDGMDGMPANLGMDEVFAAITTCTIAFIQDTTKPAEEVPDE